MKLYYTIYKVTNLINNKIYVGRHNTTNPEDGYLGSGIRITRAVQKYGKHNFKKEILLECADMDELCDIEELLVDAGFIARLDTYNLGKGGKGSVEEHTLSTREKISLSGKGRVPWMKGKTHSPQTLEKMRVSSTGRRHSEKTKQMISANSKGRPGKPNSPETRAKLSAALKGQIPWNKGKPRTLESKAKQSATMKKKPPATDATKAKLSAAMKRVWAARKTQRN